MRAGCKDVGMLGESVSMSVSWNVGLWLPNFVLTAQVVFLFESGHTHTHKHQVTDATDHSTASVWD